MLVVAGAAGAVVVGSWVAVMVQLSRLRHEAALAVTWDGDE